jgi:hypothetical protein
MKRLNPGIVGAQRSLRILVMGDQALGCGSAGLKGKNTVTRSSYSPGHTHRLGLSGEEEAVLL